jgi:hypothetical protein
LPTDLAAYKIICKLDIERLPSEDYSPDLRESFMANLRVH